MSVIFETLQKLSRREAEADTEEAVTRPRRNAYALKTVLLSPVSVLLLGVLVFGLGYGLVVGLRHLQRSAHLDPTVVAAAEPPGSAMAAPQAAQQVPPPPDLRHLDGDLEKASAEAPPAITEPAFTGPDVPPPSAAQVAALKPAAAGFASAPTWDPPSEPAAGILAPASAAAFATADAADSAKGSTVPINDFQTGEFLLPSEPPSAASLDETKRAAQAVPARFSGRPEASTNFAYWPGKDSAGLPTMARPGSAEAATGLMNAAQAAYGGATTLPPLPTTAAPARADGVDEAVRVKKRTPIPRYTELVNRLQVAAGNGDTQTVDRLLGDFAAVKGKNHPYLLKLKAYQYLQARDFASAERLLNQVLAQDQMDRDANINMVVVEASTGRIDAARQRAARLAELFPEDETLAAMGRRLN